MQHNNNNGWASTKATKLADTHTHVHTHTHTHTGTHALAHTMAIVTGWGYAMGSSTMAEHKLPGRATSTCPERGRKREGVRKRGRKEGERMERGIEREE